MGGSRNFNLHPGELCAGGEEKKDACDGDGGSPLVCQSKRGKWTVVGLGMTSHLSFVDQIQPNDNFNKMYVPIFSGLGCGLWKTRRSRSLR